MTRWYRTTDERGYPVLINLEKIYQLTVGVYIPNEFYIWAQYEPDGVAKKLLGPFATKEEAEEELNDVDRSCLQA